MDLVQITSFNNAIILNLTDTRPYVVDIMGEIDQFRFPHYFSSTGFNYTTKH